MNPTPHIQDKLEQAPIEVLAQYLSGELSEAENREVEALVAENPLYADALEGLRSLPDPALAQAAASDLRFKAHELLRKKHPAQRRFNFMQYATAAVAVLVVLFVASAGLYFANLREEKMEAPALSAERQEQAPALQPQLPSPEMPSETLAAPGPQASAPAKTGERLITEARPEVEAVEEAAEIAMDEVADEEEAFAPAEPVVALPPPGAGEPAKAAADSHSLSLTLQTQGKPTLSKDQQRAYEDAITKEEAEARRKAEEEQKLIAQREMEKKVQAEAEARRTQVQAIPPVSDSDAITAMKYPVNEVDSDRAVAEEVIVGYKGKKRKREAVPAPPSQPWMADSARVFFENEAYEKALPLLELISTDRKAEAYHEARFLLARTYLALGREKEGKKLLKKVSNDRLNPYFLDAYMLLKEMEGRE